MGNATRVTLLRGVVARETFFVFFFDEHCSFIVDVLFLDLFFGGGLVHTMCSVGGVGGSNSLLFASAKRRRHPAFQLTPNCLIMTHRYSAQGDGPLTPPPAPPAMEARSTRAASAPLPAADMPQCQPQQA